MYAPFTDVRGLDVVARDEEKLGTLHDLYIDVRDWRVAYAVIETGSWFSSHRVLAPPLRVGKLDPDSRCLRSDLLRYDIESAPPSDSVSTVDDRNSPGLLPGGPGPFLGGAAGTMMPLSMMQMPLAGGGDGADVDAPVTEEERHLRSAHEIVGYALHGSDDEVGKVQDLLIDREDWSIAFLAIDTGQWLSGKVVVVAPKWASEVSWDERAIAVDLTRERVEASPALENLDGLDRGYATRLSDFYRF